MRTIALAPGGTARAALRVADTGVYAAGTCRPTTAAGFRVYPPGSTVSALVPFPAGACSKRGPAYLQVEAVSGM